MRQILAYLLISYPKLRFKVMQSASLCGKYPYISDLYLQIFLVLLYIL